MYSKLHIEKMIFSLANVLIFPTFLIYWQNRIAFCDSRPDSSEITHWIYEREDISPARNLFDQLTVCFFFCKWFMKVVPNCSNTEYFEIKTHNEDKIDYWIKHLFRVLAIQIKWLDAGFAFFLNMLLYGECWDYFWFTAQNKDESAFNIRYYLLILNQNISLNIMRSRMNSGFNFCQFC